MEVGAMNNIMSQLPIDTKLLRFNLGSDEEIQEMEVSDLSDITANDIHTATIILASYMSAFGVDVRSIGKGLIEDTTNAIVDLRNLLINADWENTTIKINGETTTAIDYIKSAFNIFNKTDFINGLFRNLVDLALNSEVNGDNTIISADSETYNMMKLIAFCWGTNGDFTKETVGPDTQHTYTIDVSDLDDVEDKLALAFKEKGYLADTVDKVYMSNAFKSLLDVEGTVNYNKYFPYMHVLAVKGYPGNPYENSVDTENPKWCPVFYFTKEPVDDVFFEMETFTYGSRQGWIRWKPNFKKNGELITQGQEMMKIGANQTNWGYGAIGTLETCYYMNYNGQILNNFEIKNRTDPQATVRVKGYSQNYGDYNDDRWSSTFFYNQNNDGQGNPKLEFEWIVLNNEFVTGSVTQTHEPAIDSRVEGKIDNDLIDLINYFLIYPIIISPTSIQAILHPTNNPIDTGRVLKTDTIDISLNVSLIDGTPIETILEDLDQEYNPEFSTTINYNNDGYNFLFAIPNKYTAKFWDLDSQNNFFFCLWDMGLGDLTDRNLNYFDCVDKVFRLPFKLKAIDLSLGEKGTDVGEYNPAKLHATLGPNTLDGSLDLTHNREVWVNKIVYPIRVMTTKPVFVGNIVKKNGKKQPAFGNFLDYTATKASVYIPFVGEKEIDINLIMYRYVYLEYVVCITTGDFIATLYSYRFKDHKKDCYKYASPDMRFKKAYPVISAQGNMAINYPIVGRPSADAIGALSNAVGAVGNLLTLNVGGAIQSGINAYASTQPGAVMSKGALSDTHAYLSNWTPYITIMKQEAIRGYSDESKASAFNQILGLKSERGIKIKHMENGFHKLRGVKLDGLRCTETERQELQQIMMDGFYTSIKKT